MGILKDLQEKREKEKKEKEREIKRKQREKEYKEKYAVYVAVEDDISRMMDQVPPDYVGVNKVMNKIKDSPIPEAGKAIWALCQAACNVNFNVRAFLGDEYDFDTITNSFGKYNEGITALYEWSLAQNAHDEKKFDHFQKGSNIEVASYKPDYYRVIPQLCRVGLARCYYHGEGTRQDFNKAKTICKDIIENSLIPKGYKEYADAERIMNAIAEYEESERARIEEEKRKEEEEKRFEEEAKRKDEEIKRLTIQLFNERFREDVVKLLQEDPPKYKEVKELLSEYEDKLPDEGKLYLAISIFKEMIEHNKELSRDQNVADGKRFINILNSIENESSTLWYYRSFVEIVRSRFDISSEGTVYGRSYCFAHGARLEEDTNIFDKESRAKCLVELAKYEFEKAKNDKAEITEIKEGTGEKLYDEMKRIACALVDGSYDDDFELWKEAKQIEVLEPYSWYALSALALELCKDHDPNPYTRRDRLLEKFSLRELIDFGNFNLREKNEKLGYYFFDALMSDIDKAASILTDKGFATCLSVLIRYCVNNDLMQDAIRYGNYALEKRCVAPSEYNLILAFMLSFNNGYFMTDDRPDEKGRYTDNDRIKADVFRASVIYDGVLG